MLRLWVDSCVARTSTQLRDLCQLAGRKGIQIVIHPQVYLERRRQARAELLSKFNERRFDSLLEQLGIVVPRFELDQRTAATWADTLHERYPSNKDWEEAKQRTLGGELRDAFSVLPGDMPMTTDWLISLVVEHEESSRVITNDKREEWRALREANPRRALRWDDALAWLQALPDAPPSDPGSPSP